jgi:nucleoside phosphorylase
MVALREEARSILEERAFAWRQVNDRVWDSERFPLRLALSGVGKTLAAWCFARHAAEARRIVSLGCSAALGHEEVGSLWIGDEFVEYDLDLSARGIEAGITPWEGMESPIMRSSGKDFVEMALSACTAARLDASLGRTASGDALPVDGEAARALAARTGARLVDMESASIAKLALLRACVKVGHDRRLCPEFLAFRYVADNVDHGARGTWKEEVKKASVDFADFLLALAEEESKD